MIFTLYQDIHLKMWKPLTDQINNELTEHGCDELLKTLYRLTVEFWRKETLPSEWNNISLLIPVYFNIRHYVVL